MRTPTTAPPTKIPPKVPSARGFLKVPSPGQTTRPAFTFVYRVGAAAIAVGAGWLVVLPIAWRRDWEITPLLQSLFCGLVAVVVAVGEILRGRAWAAYREGRQERIDRVTVERLLADLERPDARQVSLPVPMAVQSITGRIVKRVLDVVLSLVGLIVLGPTFCLIALMIKLDSPGPVFFGQQRVGLGGRPFRMIKFRTMVNPSEQRERLRELYDHTLLERYDDSLRTCYAPDDPRVTRAGRFLRRTSLDELPRLFNVLLGDMSLVGPPPALLSEVEHLEAWQMERFAMKPGITGLWRVSGGRRKPCDEMFDLDRRYIRGWTLWRDIMILLRTVPGVLLREDAW